MLEREGAKRLQDKANFMVAKMSPSIRILLSAQKLDDPIIERVKEQTLAHFAGEK